MLLLPRASAPSPTDDFWYHSVGTSTASGVRITPDTAMRSSAVFACVRVLAESVGSLPLHIYKRTSAGKEIARDHPLYRTLHTAPNRWQTSIEWREMMEGHLALRGNAYARKVRTGRSLSLIPLHPDVVTVEVDGDRIRYRVKDTDGTESVYTDEEIMHIRGLSSDGVMGLSPIELARESIGISLAAEEFGARVFQNDATPPGILTHPGAFKDNDSRANFGKSWAAAQSGRNRGKTAVLENGITYKSVGMTNRDTQWLESRKFQINDIARIFRVPPHMIGDLERATFSNIEHQSLEFVMHTLRPWLVRWEQAITRDLLGEGDYYAEFTVDGLLRGDQKSRYEAYASGISAGWLTRNEARALENRNPIDGLDEPLTPLNMAAADEEVGALRALWDDAHPGASIKRVREFYAKHSARLIGMGATATDAHLYCEAAYHQIKGAANVPELIDQLREPKASALARIMETER